jgi:hypothetical protein
MPRRPRLQAAAAYTNATAHLQRGRHRTSRRRSGSVRSQGSCRPHHPARRPDMYAPGPRSRPLPWTHLVPYSTPLALTKARFSLINSDSHRADFHVTHQVWAECNGPYDRDRQCDCERCVSSRPSPARPVGTVSRLNSGLHLISPKNEMRQV